jgi:hypothetical protein
LIVLANGTYDGDTIPCEQMCKCAYCDKVCDRVPYIPPDYSCRIYGISCSIVGYSTAGVIGLLTIAAVGASLIYQLVEAIRNRRRRTRSGEEERLLT